MGLAVLFGGAVLVVVGGVLLRNWRRVDASLGRFSRRVGWPTEESTVVRTFLAGVVIIGLGWLLYGLFAVS